MGCLLKMSDELIHLSDVIRQLRIQSGETQKNFGAFFGKRGATISTWENETAPVPLYYFKKIADLADVSVTTIKEISVELPISSEEDKKTIEELFEVHDIVGTFYSNVSEVLHDRGTEPIRDLKFLIDRELDIKLSKVQEIADMLDMDAWALLMEDEQ